MEEKDITLSQSNALTQSRYDFSRIEKNVVYHIIQKVRQDYVEGTMQRDLWQNMYVYIKNADLVKITNEKHTKEAKAALKSLRHRDIEIEDEHGNWLDVGFINYAKYNAKSKTYEVEVSKEIMPHLVELAQCFTSYSLTVVVSLKSKYSQRIYELCCQYRERGVFFLDQERLRKVMKLEDKYPQNQDFKRFVLDVAYNELKEAYDAEQSDLWFEVMSKGRGKNVRYYFKIHTRDEGQNSVNIDERKKALYIFQRCKEIYKRDPKFSDRILKALDFSPDKISPVYEKLERLEGKYKGADLAKMLRFILDDDFGIK